MTQLTLNRIAPGRDEFRPSGSGCHGCSGCGDRPQVVSLSQVHGNSAVVELPVSAQWAMLWNSWMKPLVAAMLAALGCEITGVSEPMAIGAVALAFLGGYLVCYALPQNALKISEK